MQALIILLTSFSIESNLFDPVAIYLTWQQDPTTTMTIDWHTTPEDGERKSEMNYQRLDEDEWKFTEGNAFEFPFSNRTVHRVELSGLEPETMYRFRFGEDSKEYLFRTMPTNIDGKSVVFATGGDTRLDKAWMESTNTAIMNYDIDFIAWGGDLAYGDGREDQLYRWYEWFDAIKNTLIYENGRIIPIIVSTGNHEVIDGYYFNHGDYEQSDKGREQIAPYFYNLLAFPGHPGYGVLDFGDYLSMISLDTEHTNPIEGEQVSWLEEVLGKRDGVPHIFPFYHVPAYPSHRLDSDRTVSNVRNFFTPLFEKYGVRVAFENHDHTYKRTYPVKEGKIAEDGIIYLGDGAWGVDPRPGRRSDEWYIHRFMDVRHAIIVTLESDIQEYIMVNELGEIIDTFNTNDPVTLPPLLPPVEKTTLLYPSGFPPRTELQPEFSWSAVDNASEYQLQLTNSNFASNMLLDSTVINTILLYPFNLETDEYYRWRVRPVNESGAGPWSDNILFRTIWNTVDYIEENSGIPSEYILDHNYPNPFNPITNIRYGLPEAAHVKLRLFDLTGREIALLVNDVHLAGYHTIVFDSKFLASGVYVYNLIATPSEASGNKIFTQTRFMTLVK